MNILLTGSFGFVGNAILDRLKNDHKIIEFDYVYGHDILNYDVYPTEDIDLCIHCAAVANLNDSARDLNKNYMTNTFGTYKLAKWCEEKNIRLLYISTCCVWGSTWQIETGSFYEDYTLPKPTEEYAMSKLAGEYSIKCTKAEAMHYRIGTVYGPGMRKELFNYIAINKAYNGDEIKVHGDGEQTRQYIYIDDLCDAIESGIENWQSGEVFNITSSERISVNDTIVIVSDILEKKVNVKYVQDRIGQIKHENINITKAADLINWRPKTMYLTGMQKTIDWYKKQREQMNND